MLISGYIKDRHGNLAANVKVRACRKDDGLILSEAITGDGITNFVAPDPYYKHVYLNIDMSGANDSVVFNDLSSYKNTIITHGDTKLKTNTGLFIGPAIYLDGNGDYLSVAAPTIDGDFTLEMDAYINSGNSYINIIECRSGANYSNYIFGIENSRRIRYISAIGDAYSSVNNLVNFNALNILSIVRKDGVFSFYINGNKDSSTFTDNRIIVPAQSTLRLFAAIDPVYWNGYVKFFRITKYARYTKSYNVANINYSGFSGSRGGPLGYYELSSDYTGEIDLIFISPDGIKNDMIYRATIL